MAFYWDEIQKLAKAHHLQDPLDNMETFRRFLDFWWSQKFNRPLKDPLLASYTTEELAYEWLRNIYLIPENDPRKKMEDQLAKNDEEDWIRAQLDKHIQQVKAAKAAELEPKKDENPIVTPEDISTKFE